MWRGNFLTDILRVSQLAIFSQLEHFPTKVLQVLSSNSYKVRGGKNEKWCWIFAFENWLHQVTSMQWFKVSAKAFFSPLGWPCFRAGIWQFCKKIAKFSTPGLIFCVTSPLRAAQLHQRSREKNQIALPRGQQSLSKALTTGPGG